MPWSIAKASSRELDLFPSSWLLLNWTLRMGLESALHREILMVVGMPILLEYNWAVRRFMIKLVVNTSLVRLTKVHNQNVWLFIINNILPLLGKRFVKAKHLISLALCPGCPSICCVYNFQPLQLTIIPDTETAASAASGAPVDVASVATNTVSVIGCIALGAAGTAVCNYLDVSAVAKSTRCSRSQILIWLTLAIYM